MPTYIYKREDGSTFEIMQKINDEPLTECPETGQSVKRVITGGAGVVYKGDGWYVKDYKDQGKPKSDNKETGTAAKNGSSDTSASSKDSSGSDAKTTTNTADSGSTK